MATMQVFGRTAKKKAGIIVAAVGGLVLATGLALVIAGIATSCSYDEDDWEFDCGSKSALFISGGLVLPVGLITLGVGLVMICYIRHRTLITSMTTRTEMHINHQYGATTVSTQRTVGNSPYPQQAAAPPYSQQAAVPPYPQQEAAPPYSQQAEAPSYPQHDSAPPYYPQKESGPSYPQQAAAPPYPQQAAAPPYPQQAAAPPYPQQPAAPPYPQQAAAPPYPQQAPGLPYEQGPDQPYPEKSAY